MKLKVTPEITGWREDAIGVTELLVISWVGKQGERRVTFNKHITDDKTLISAASHRDQQLLDNLLKNIGAGHSFLYNKMSYIMQELTRSNNAKSRITILEGSPVVCSVDDEGNARMFCVNTMTFVMRDVDFFYERRDLAKHALENQHLYSNAWGSGCSRVVYDSKAEAVEACRVGFSVDLEHVEETQCVVEADQWEEWSFEPDDTTGRMSIRNLESKGSFWCIPHACDAHNCCEFVNHYLALSPDITVKQSKKRNAICRPWNWEPKEEAMSCWDTEELAKMYVDKHKDAPRSNE